MGRVEREPLPAIPNAPVRVAERMIMRQAARTPASGFFCERNKSDACFFLNEIKAMPASFDVIPPSLAPFFQEYDLSQLDLARSANTIIERVLQYGDRAELRWLFEHYSKKQVSDWVAQWGRFGLPEPHLSFWRLVLKIEDP
ncbi:MAG: DUF6922 domain-containing protein [Chloroflexota bacterium]